MRAADERNRTAWKAAGVVSRCVMAFAGLVTGLLIAASAQTPLFVPDVPPQAALIQVSSPDAGGDVRVIGFPGAVPAVSTVFLVTLDTGHWIPVQAGGDGRFSGSLFAPTGTSILIKADPSGVALGGLLQDGSVPLLLSSTPILAGVPGTIVRVPTPPDTGAGVPFGGAGLIRFTNPPDSPFPAWTFQGTINSQALQPGDTLRVQGTLRIVSPALASAGAMRAHTARTLDRVTGPDSLGVMAQASFASTLLTPMGLPIERVTRAYNDRLDQGVILTLTKVAADRAEAVADMSLPIPADLLSGFYIPRLTFFSFEGVPTETPPSRPVLTPGRAQRREINSMRLPIVRVGMPTPPRLFWTLLTDTLSNGTRGAGAVEDRERFGVASRILTQAETFIVPRLDPASGHPLTYRLEPFALTVSVGNEAPPHPPLIPFHFPSGQLTVRVQKPDGSVDVIGPEPFVQARMKSLADSNGTPVDTGGGHITDAYQLSTMDPRFEVPFAQDGRHVITLDGTIQDIWGNTWTGGGTYEVHVARLLALDTAVLPGTPFEMGDVFNPGLVLTPAVPADVEVRLRLAPNSDASRMVKRTVRGQANRFGHFYPPASDILLDQPGEFRVDVTASFRDEQGTLWMGARTWGGVVAPRNPAIIAHGRRGIDSGPTIGPQGFFRSQTGISAFIPGASHVFFPFNSGDIQWMEKSDTVIPAVTIQDPGGTLVSLLRARGFDARGHGQNFQIPMVLPGTFDERAVVGEVPLFSSRPDFRDPHLDPALVDLWGYNYRSVQRPLVRVREEIGEDFMPASPYWRFREQYARQIGVGRNGDLPNEIKFQYGAAVLRGPALAQPHYAIYGSLFVLVPDTTPPGNATRVFPPFQGNGGGPSGGPIMTLKGREIDLFLHLTGVRPGSVLEVGDTFALAGAVGPPLPAVVTYTITRPDGQRLPFSGRANRVGFYYRPEHDFVVEQPGLYTVDLQVSYDGITSAGQVTAPFPTGDVLGSAAGRFVVYAVPRGSPLLEVDLPRTAFFTPPGEFNLLASAPAGMQVTRGHVTVMMPGFLLETRELSPDAGQLAYRYDSITLARDFPNLDVDHVGRPEAADVVTFSLFATGTNADGSPAFAARVFVLHGPELLNLAPPGAPKLAVQLNQTTLRPGDTLRVGLAAKHLGPTVTADFYCGLLLPDGMTLVFVTSLSPLAWVVSRLDATPQTFRPLITDILIPQGLDVTATDVLVSTFSGQEPPGSYVFFAFLTPPGAFVDGRIGANDLLAIDAQSFSFGP